MKDLTLEQRIGPSTLCLRGIPLEEAIDRALDAGFSGFELTPITYGGPGAFDTDRCEDLRKRFEAFSAVTVHSSGMGGADICSADESHRRKSREGYLDLMRVAREVGAGTVTFHPGRGDSPEQQTAQVRSENISFGKVLREAAAESSVAIGYELFDHGVAEEIGCPNFGVLFDVGHASRRSPDVTTDDVIRMIDDLSDQTVQYHVHGVGDPDKTDHLPFSENTWLDYGRIIAHIESQSFEGPMILEIGIRDEDWERNLQDCVSAREELLTHAAA